MIDYIGSALLSMLLVGIVPLTEAESDLTLTKQSTRSKVVISHEAAAELGGKELQPAKKISCGLYDHDLSWASTITRENQESSDCFADSYVIGDGTVCLTCNETGSRSSCSPCGGGFCMGDQVEEGNQ